MKLKALIILVFGLAAIYFILDFVDKNPKESTMLSSILTADTASIDAIVFYPEIMDKQQVKLYRDGQQWFVLSGDNTFVADKSSVQMILTELSNVRIEQLVGTKSSDWTKFELSDEQASSLTVEAKGKEVAHIYMGGFNYNESTQQPTTYVRIKGDDRSYSVTGYLTGTFNRELSAYRLKTITNFDVSTISKVQFTYPADSSFTLSRNNDIWFRNLQSCDSIAVSNYISSLSRLGSTGFINESIDFSVLSKDYSIRIEGNGFEPVELDAYTGHPVYGKIITANTHPDGIFNGEISDFFSKNFVSPSRFDIKEL